MAQPACLPLQLARACRITAPVIARRFPDLDVLPVGLGVHQCDWVSDIHGTYALVISPLPLAETASCRGRTGGWGHTFRVSAPSHSVDESAYG
jgi:hypothetical protein